MRDRFDLEMTAVVNALAPGAFGPEPRLRPPRRRSPGGTLVSSTEGAVASGTGGPTANDLEQTPGDEYGPDMGGGGGDLRPPDDEPESEPPAGPPPEGGDVPPPDDGEEEEPPPNMKRPPDPTDPSAWWKCWDEMDVGCLIDLYENARNPTNRQWHGGAEGDGFDGVYDPVGNEGCEDPFGPFLC